MPFSLIELSTQITLNHYPEVKELFINLNMNICNGCAAFYQFFCGMLHFNVLTTVRELLDV